MAAVDERIELIRRIMNDNVTKKQVQKKVDDLEKKYGENAFLPSDFEKMEKPWTSDYYDKLETLCLSGDGSKKLILHMAEVKDNLHKKKRNKSILILGVILLVIVLISIIIMTIKNK